ncbi:MAG: hypothetical protein LBC56_00540 [Oscillospiraceae bacterium]|jgi:hypothetical protein|nr:hypothetical protein [Oscillospiraceae bacterium]
MKRGKWEISPGRILTPESWSISVELDKEDNKDAAGQSPIYVKKLKPQTLNLSTKFSVFVGIDVEKELEEWENLLGKRQTGNLCRKSSGDTAR